MQQKHWQKKEANEPLLQANTFQTLTMWNDNFLTKFETF